jgi:biopolymer transport protein ExbB
MSKFIVKAAVIAFASALMVAPVVNADEVSNLQDLLRKVEQGRIAESKEAAERERRFAADKANQASMLAQAQAERSSEEARSSALEKKFQENELVIADKQRQLRERLGSLTELFGHITSAAGDLRSNVETSLTSAQYPGREAFLNDLIGKMGNAEQLPSIEEIEKLWFEIQREMTESGKVVSFTATISHPDGSKETTKVVRIGTFNVVSEAGQYLKYDAATGALQELARQPSGPYMGWASSLASATDGVTEFGIDPTGPSGGTFLNALIDSPTFAERVDQGGGIGYLTLALGAVAALVGIFRLLALTLIGGKVKSQLNSKSANTDNPLGRVLKVAEDNPNADTETLELKLSEAVLKEVPSLEFGLGFLKVTAAVAPLLGLLGTVTGMIDTFQAITIFGAGDPKAMAGGISAALVTTVQGLVVAIPIVLLHTFLSMRSKAVVQILDERVTGIIAERSEKG